MGKSIQEIAQDPTEVVEANRWWLKERTGWPLDRALRVWLAYERDVDWNPDDAADQATYDEMFRAVLASGREVSS